MSSRGLSRPIDYGTVILVPLVVLLSFAENVGQLVRYSENELRPSEAVNSRQHYNHTHCRTN